MAADIAAGAIADAAIATLWPLFSVAVVLSLLPLCCRCAVSIAAVAMVAVAMAAVAIAAVLLRLPLSLLPLC